MVQSNIRPTDLHRVFLQSMLSRRVATEDVMVELYKRAISACHVADENFRPAHDTSKQGARSFFKEINAILEQGGMQMSLTAIKDENKGGKETWALINKDHADEAAFMTDYEPLQIAYFKLVINEIMESYPANSIGSQKALQLTSKLNSQMAKSAAGVLLNTFVARGWLHVSKRGWYSLAPRAIMELESWLGAEYDDMVKECQRCNRKPVLTGVICGNDDCDAHLHKTCYSVLLQIENPLCPGCKKPLAQYAPRPLGERAASGQNGSIQKQKRKRAGKKGGASGAAADESEEEDELDDEEEEDEAPQSAGKGKSRWAAEPPRKRRGQVELDEE